MGSGSTRARAPVSSGSFSDRISKILNHLNTDNNIKWSAMEREMKALSGVVIERRRLSNLATGEDVAIKLNELEALSDYFRKHGFALLDRPRLLEDLVDRGGVRFLLGSYARTPERRTDISRWDVKAMAAILGGIDRLRSGATFEIRDVIKPDDISDIESKMRSGEDVPNDAVSLCCVGSPRANIAAEIMLCKMFDLPVADPIRAAGAELPFAFVWPRSEHMRSSFSIDADKMDWRQWHCPEGRPRNDGWAMRVGEAVYLTTPKDNASWKTYGVAVAQRRPSGQVWLVVAGLTGSATCAVAEVVASDLIMACLDQGKPADKGSSVLWAAIEAVTAFDLRLPGDRRVIESWKILGPPQSWRPS